MKKISLISMLIFSVLSFTGLYAKTAVQKTSTQSLDQIVAIVNDDVITKTELTHALVTTKMQMTQSGVPLPTENTLHDKVLEQLINQKLELQVAKQAGIQVSETDLDGVVENIARQNNMATAELYQRINQEGISSKDYRHEMRDQMIIHKIQQQEIASHINITKDEITHFLHSHATKSNTPNEYHVADILVPLSETPSADQLATAKLHANHVLMNVRRGQSLGTLTQSTPDDDHSSLQSNDLGWRKLDELPSAFAQQVAHMKAKDVAGPIQAPNGLHVIQVAEIRPISGAASTAPNMQQAEESLMQQKLGDAVQNWISKLRAQAFIVTNP